MVNLLAISLFVLSHLIPSLPGVRPTLIRLMGRNGYLATYGVLSLVLLGWVFHAAISAPWCWRGFPLNGRPGSRSLCLRSASF
ncbi:NnrU family protein [Pelagibacterium flavum]|uniref:NnrU family protein n=1 Tax=Pelagibacterium flavum TaxID=2984530 RepID=UPI0038CDB8BD